MRNVATRGIGGSWREAITVMYCQQCKKFIAQSRYAILRTAEANQLPLDDEYFRCFKIDFVFSISNQSFYKDF
jgi:hypothetical protein